VLDLPQVSDQDFAALKRDYAKLDSTQAWWLANDQRLLIAGNDALLADWSARYPVLQRIEHADVANFALQSVACDEADSKMHLPAMMKIGRGNLVRRPVNFAGRRVIDGLIDVPFNQQPIQQPRLVRSKTVEPGIQQLVQRIQPSRWFATLSQLASWKRNSYSPEIDLARDYLANEFTSLGLSVETPSVTIASGVSAENVIATLVGSTFPDEWIVIGAHYDSRNVSLTNTSNPSPGAEDNASGCAGVVEVARVLAATQPKRTIKFICFTGEEQNLLGAEAFAAGLASAGTLSRVKLAIIMDMIGYSSTTALDVLLETSSALQAVLPAFQSAAADYSPGMVVTTSLSPFGSDHMPFINRGVPSLLLIENEWDSYPHYHKATDLPANVTNAELEGPAILRMLLAVAATRAEVTLPLLADGFETNVR
jgi:Iap family predicted aminopeptidase